MVVRIMGLTKQLETIETKEKPFRGTSYIIRPTDTTAYTAGDSINASTPVTMNFDLSNYGVTSGDFIAITNVRVICSTKLSGASINTWIFPSTVATTNDNSELTLTDEESQTGGVVIPCTNLYTTANNSRMVSDSGLWLIQLTTTNVYIVLQAGSGFTPGASDRYDVFIEGVILK